MSYASLGGGGLNYSPCRYGDSKLLFRGPMRKLDSRYIAFLGGTKTYGKFVQSPYCDLVEQELGITAVNLGCVNAGLDVFVGNDEIADLANGASMVVVQIMSAQNMSNRFYQVQPRRNDRVCATSKKLENIFGEVDFSQFNFTSEMLHALYKLSPGRFDMVLEEMRAAWCARMKLFLSKIHSDVMLLWIDNHPPQDNPVMENDGPPSVISHEMIEEVRPKNARYLEVVISPKARGMGTRGMFFTQMETLVAQGLMGPYAHQEIAQALSDALRPVHT